MTIYVLDTNIISLLIRRDRNVQSQYQLRVGHEDTVIGCPMVWHETRRGLLAKDAKAQMRRFQSLFASFEWQNYIRDDWSLAADWWAQRRATGRPIPDADLLIAVFAYNRNAILVSDNEKDFDVLSANIDNWKRP